MSRVRLWRQVWRAPALRAALIQLLAAPATFFLSWLAGAGGISVSLLDAALLQGALAAVLTWRCRLAPWWRAIQLLFPPALLACAALQLPPVVFLAAFLCMLGLYWSTFRTQVPFYPSGPAVWDAVARLLPAQRALRLIDIGSGLGGLVLNLARRRPDCACTGIELAPLPWLLSSLRARTQGSAARFLLGDYERLDFGSYDVVFAYLSPAAMDALWRKASREMRSGTMLLSYEFDIKAKPPDRTIRATGHGPALYVWHF